MAPGAARALLVDTADFSSVWTLRIPWVQRDCSVTVAVVTFCAGIFTETFLGLSSIVSVEFRVQDYYCAAVHGIRDVQTELKSAVSTHASRKPHGHGIEKYGALWIWFEWWVSDSRGCLIKMTEFFTNRYFARVLCLLEAIQGDTGPTEGGPWFM